MISLNDKIISIHLKFGNMTTGNCFMVGHNYIIGLQMSLS